MASAVASGLVAGGHGLADVREFGARAAAALGPVRFEWAHDGADAWVIQLHQATAATTGTTIHPGTPSRWRRFDPSPGP